MTKTVLVNNFDPIGQFKSGISSGTPWDSIVDFATSKSFCGKRLYPRQMTLLKLIYLETESMTDYDMEVIGQWAEGFKNVNHPTGVQPDIWDRIDYLKANGFTHFPHVQMVMGRRASKGIIGSILATERIAWLYSLGSWQQHFNQVPGQVAEITVVANSLTQAVTRQFRDIRNAVFACEYLRPHIVGDKQTEFYIRTPGDEQTIIENNLAGITSDREIATIYCKASSSVSTSGRGGTGLFNAYDEFAHMLAGTGSTKTGEEIYDAFQPSLDQFGHHAMTYCASSPFSKIGKFYDLYQQGRITTDSYNLREGKLKTTSFIEEAQSQDIDLDPDEISAAVAEPTFLVVQLPSWDTYRDWERSREIPILPGRTRTFPRWNSPVQYEPKEDGTPDERVQYRRMRRNPDKFKVERGGQFATVQDAYLNEVMVDRMFEPPDWRPPLEIQHQGKLSLSYRAHADPSRTNANFGFCIAHLEQAPPDEHGISWPHVIIDVLHVWKPEDFKDHTIDYVQVGEELDDYLRRFPSTTKMTYDQFNSAGLIAHQKRAFPNIRVLEKTFTLKENQDRCERFKSALNLEWVHAPRDTFADEGQSLLELELKFLQERNGRVDKQDIGPVQTKDLADCYDDQTEVLTEHGWKLFKDVGDGERVATRSPDGELRYQIPTHRITKRYVGDLMVCEEGKFNFAVTPTHRMLTVDPCTGVQKFITAHEASERRSGAMVPRLAEVRGREAGIISFEQDGGLHRRDHGRSQAQQGRQAWSGEQDQYLTDRYAAASMSDLCAVLGKTRSAIYNRAKKLGLQRGQIGDRYRDCYPSLPDTKTVDFARFLGVWLAEGTKMRDRPGNTVAITQTKPDGIFWIDAMFSRLGWPVRRTLRANGETCWSVKSRQLKDWLLRCQEEKGHELLIPDEVFSEWTRDEMAALLEGLMVGDGVWHSQNGWHSRYVTSSCRLAGDVQRLVAHLGIAAARVRKSYDAGPAVGGRHKSNHAMWSVDLDHSSASRLIPDRIQRRSYDGMVYCLTVPDSTLLTRRKGAPLWCGNCVMVVVTDLLHDSLDKWWTAINRTSVGSTDSVGLRSGRELDRISAYSAPGTGDPMQRYLAEEANRYERKTIRAERNRTVIGANKLERARRKSGHVPTYSNSRTRGFR